MTGMDENPNSDLYPPRIESGIPKESRTLPQLLFGPVLLELADWVQEWMRTGPYEPSDRQRPSELLKELKETSSEPSMPLRYGSSFKTGSLLAMTVVGLTLAVALVAKT